MLVALATTEVIITLTTKHPSGNITVTDDQGVDFEDMTFYNDGEQSTAAVRRAARDEAEDRAAHYGQDFHVRIVEIDA